jgi:hypothetical protein
MKLATLSPGIALRFPDPDDDTPRRVRRARQATPQRVRRPTYSSPATIHAKVRQQRLQALCADLS